MQTRFSLNARNTNSKYIYTKKEDSKIVPFIMLLCGCRKRKNKRSKSSEQSQPDASDEPKIDEHASPIVTLNANDNNPTVNFNESMFIIHISLVYVIFLLLLFLAMKNAMHNHYPLWTDVNHDFDWGFEALKSARAFLMAIQSLNTNWSIFISRQNWNECKHFQMIENRSVSRSVGEINVQMIYMLD